MKKFTAVVLLMAALLLTLPGCLPVDGEPETGGAGRAGEVSRVAERDVEPYEPETIEGWGEGMSSFAAYRWNGGLLEEVTKELGPGCSQLCWIDDQTVTAVFGEEVFADGVCHEGIFKFSFYNRQEDSELAAAAGLPEEDLELWSREWSWQRYRNLLQSWELAVTYEPLPEGQWVTPNWWLPPEGLTGKGEDTGDGPWPDIAGPFDADGNPLPTPEPTPFPEDRQAVEDFKFPGWEPAEGHEGYEIAAVHSTPDGRPLQIRLRWKNEEGYGCWVQIPAYALDTFWEHEGEWFVMVGVNTDGEDNGPENSTSSTIYYHTEEGTFEMPADGPLFPRWEDAEEPASVEGVSAELVSIQDFHMDDLELKVLSVKVSGDGELPNPDPDNLRVDYLYDGAWHTVYRPADLENQILGAVGIGREDEAEQGFVVPADALCRAGQYRLCHEDFGALEFTIE
nr:hypothetical protein [Acutalibacter muris]